MAKNERKSDTAAAMKPTARQAVKSPVKGDENLQRILLMLVLVVLLTFIIVPKGGLTPTDYSVGDVAPRDIKAPRDFLVPDDELTEQKRVETDKAVPKLYDYDTAMDKGVADQTLEILTSLKGSVDAGRTDAEQRAALESAFGVKFDKKHFDALQELSQRPDLKVRLTDLLSPIYRQKVAGNLNLFTADRGHGIVFRSLDTQAEIVDDANEKVLGLGELQDALKVAVAAATDLPGNQKKALLELLNPLLRPNISFNKNETEGRKQAAREAVKPVLIQVKKGEMIVREGDLLSAEQTLRLGALRDDGNRVAFWRNAAGLLLISLLLVCFAHTFAWKNIRKYRPQNRDLLFLGVTFVAQILVLKISIFISSALGSAFSYVDQTAYYYLFPFAVGTMLVRIVLNSEISLIFAIISAIITGALFGNSYAVMLFAFLTSLSGAHWVRHVTERSSLFRAGLRLGMFNFALVFALHLMTSRPFDLQLFYKLGFGLAGGLVAAVVVTGVVPLVESLFRYTTNIKLLELANMNNPVLRDLMIQAPGTYHHSIIVGNLAEAAAENINVNPLMVRVAAYYHDIGKTKKPLYFIENLGGQENRHDKLTASMSALVLIAHVKDGVEMARDNFLGQTLIDIIRQHHGTSLMKFFYDRARSRAEHGVEQIDERDYRYPGPKPQTREAALIMLADAVEAASRTLTDPTAARVQGMVQKIINNIFIDGQLDECELTLKDMHNIAKSFNLVLGGIFHHRVDYPEPVSKERVTDKVVKKNDENRDRKSPVEAKDRENPPAKSGTDDLKRLGMS